MLRYLILIGALAAMPLSSFAVVESVENGVVEPAANVELGKTEGPVWVVEATKTSPTLGPVWVVIKSKDAKTFS
jgi:hypothetical protein